MCTCLCVFVCAYALIIVSMNKILHIINTLIIIRSLQENQDAGKQLEMST